MTIKNDFLPEFITEMNKYQQEKYLTPKYKEALNTLREIHYLLGIARGGRKIEQSDLLLSLS